MEPVTTDDGTVRTYVSVDGGMSDNPRPVLYDAGYTAALASRASTAPTTRSRVVGKHCESGDVVVHEVALPSDVVPGDLVATPVTGAYGRSMASNYNSVPRPPVLAVRAGSIRVLVRRETGVGHGGRSLSRTIGLTTEELQFVADRTGLLA